MTAPEPTAGERKMIDSLGNEHPADDLCDWAGCYPASPPADVIHDAGCSWETGPDCNCGADPARISAAPEPPRADVELSDAERFALVGLGATERTIEFVERIVVERVRVVEGERDALMRASWLAYERSGADTDGDKQWHCAPEMAGRALVHAVETLRKDYDDSLDESESAEAAHRALQAAVEALADEWAEDYPGPTAACNRTPDEWARDLRALLAGGAR